MTKEKLSYRKAHYFSDLMCDYINGDEHLKSLYGLPVELRNFKKQIALKESNFKAGHRELLANSLLGQYRELKDAKASRSNIELLKDSKTFTVTTGHQLNLFTGPLYFLYKIVSVINLCKQLKKEYPSYHFVPIYWMATEDHDFEEIQYFNFNGKKVVWDRSASGAVGRLSTDGLQAVYDQLSVVLGSSTNASYLLELFESSYLEHHNLADATRYLAHQLFGNEGLVIIDGDDPDLKNLMIPYFKEELINQSSHKQVSQTIEHWPERYNVQVNPRAINLFYLKDDIRERIVFENDVYAVLNTDLVFSPDEIMIELQTHPERFSPNVILRPFYQEVILPNLCYIGGGGEMAYWLELKRYFDNQNVVFPMLLMRNSALLMTSKQAQKTKKLDLQISDLFLKDYQLEEIITRQHSKILIDFTPQREHLKQQFKDLYTIASKTDKSFKGAVGAQEQKQINGLNHLEKRLLKAQKRKLKDYILRAIDLQKELFPQGNLQERKENFSFFYKEYGKELLEVLKENLDPLDPNFTVLVLDN